jgi:hypothetical protein
MGKLDLDKSASAFMYCDDCEPDLSPTGDPRLAAARFSGRGLGGGWPNLTVFYDKKRFRECRRVVGRWCLIETDGRGHMTSYRYWDNATDPQVPPGSIAGATVLVSIDDP